MSKPDSNPARQSAGGAAGAHGVSFEAGAAAWWIAQMLVGSRLSTRQFGIEENAVPVRVGGQTGMLADDLGVEFSNGQRLFGQCKSRVRFSANWPTDNNGFASTWIQFYRQLRESHAEEQPIFVLCYEDETEPLCKLCTVLNRYRDHGGLVGLGDRRVAVTADEQRVAATVLQLFDRLSAEQELAGLRTDQSRLLCCTYLHHLQMEVSGPDYLQVAQQLQSAVLANADDVGDAMRVISDLGGKVHKERTSIGVDQVRTEFRLATIQLQDAADHRADWSRLENASRIAKQTVFTTIGPTLHLNRVDEVQRLTAALKTSHAVIVLGPSGGGKSGIIKGWADGLNLSENRVLWFAAGGWMTLNFGSEKCIRLDVLALRPFHRNGEKQLLCRNRRYRPLFFRAWTAARSPNS